LQAEEAALASTTLELSSLSFQEQFPLTSSYPDIIMNRYRYEHLEHLFSMSPQTPGNYPTPWRWTITFSINICLSSQYPPRDS
jgi:hypothetical protein